MNITAGLPRLALGALALAAAIVAACGGSAKTSSGPRSFAMGFGSLGQDRTDEAYIAALRRIGVNGEVVMIQRTPPWKDFMDGGSPSDVTQRAMETETRLVRENKLKLFFAVDPIDASRRDRPAKLPSEWAGYGFGRADLQTAFIAYVQWVAANYKPDYLALASEVNMYAERNSHDFQALVALYGKAYDAVKAVSPDTLVFPTFQYEDLLGVLPGEGHLPAWQLVQQFDAKMDLLAITTYPNFAFRTADDIPADYYTQISDHTVKPVVFAEAGFSSEPVERANNASESEQAAFLRRLLADADALAARFLIWYFAADPHYDMPSPAFQHIGLLREDGSKKQAWEVWQENRRRPLQPAGG